MKFRTIISLFCLLLSLLALFLSGYLAGERVAENRNAVYIQNLAKALSNWRQVDRIFMQQPPTIGYDCMQSCQSFKYPTWDEYVEEYQEYMEPQ